MAVHIFWPPLAVLSMGVMVVIFLILKYGDKWFKARTAPMPQNYEIENQSSENTTVNAEERFLEEEERTNLRYEMEIIPISEKTKEYAF